MSARIPEAETIHPVDATKEDEVVDAVVVEETHSTALEVRPASREVLMPMDTEQVVAGMRAYQDLLPKLLAPSDWQDTGSEGKFVKKSGWRKIARAFNLSVMVVSVRVERDENGLPTRAEAIARAQAPNGQVSDADGYCSVDEPRFAQERGRKKLENDLRATATTRAKNRAISDLVGMGEVSAEEVDAGASVSSPAATSQQLDVLTSAVNFLLPEDRAVALWDRIKEISGGEITTTAALVAIAVISAKKKAEGQGSDQGTGASVGGDTPPASSSSAPVGSAPSPDPAPAEGIEDELPADRGGL
jgi:hypothetical protein